MNDNLIISTLSSKIFTIPKLLELSLKIDTSITIKTKFVDFSFIPTDHLPGNNFYTMTIVNETLTIDNCLRKGLPE